MIRKRAAGFPVGCEAPGTGLKQRSFADFRQPNGRAVPAERAARPSRRAAAQSAMRGFINPGQSRIRGNAGADSRLLTIYCLLPGIFTGLMSPQSAPRYFISVSECMA